MKMQDARAEICFDSDVHARLASAGAMWPELQKTLAAVSPTVSPDEVKTLIIDENLLAKATASNRRKVARKLLQRYTLDATDPVFVGFRHEYEHESAQSQQALLGYLMMSTNDALMRALNTEWLAPKLSRPGDDRTGFVFLASISEKRSTDCSISIRQGSQRFVFEAT